MTRRTFFSRSIGGALSSVLFARGQPSSAMPAGPPDRLPGSEKGRKLKVVYIGAHPDDWESCAGTLARYAKEGHDVLCFSLTPGDALGMAAARHIPVDKLAALMREDAIQGTEIIGAQFRELDQHNAKMVVDPETYEKFNKTLSAENPDIVFGMWPIEFHPDHRAAANIAFNAWLQADMQFEFYFCEMPDYGEMTSQLFVPNRWIDVSSVMALKHESIIADRFIKGWWPEVEMSSKFRGYEYGCRYAEAFIRLTTVGSITAPKSIRPGYWGNGLGLAPD